MERKILEECVFPNADVKFLRSMRRRLKRTAKNLYDGKWEKATYAHLTPFFHAKKRGIPLFWNIDADDTSILLSVQKTLEGLNQVEELVKRENLCACSLDMWFSKTNERHWSLGVLLINTQTADFCEIFRAQKDKSWMKAQCVALASTHNLDWFFTYLRNCKNYKIETFCIDDCYFIHWGEMILTPTYAWISLWRDGRIIFPLAEALHIEEIASFELKNVYRISVGSTLQDSLKIFEHEICVLRNLQKMDRTLYGLIHYATK